jgi:cytochrome c biogenesis protein CcmG/thiol:disulfide interchange protein DsbE
VRLRTSLAAATLLVLAACGSSDSGGTSPTFGDGPTPTTDATGLAAAKHQAGIRDCPAPTSGASSPDLPDLTLDCLGGGTPVALPELTGTPTVINFWASWCGPCREELPLLARADKAYRGDIRVIGVDFADSAPDAAIELARAAGVTYPLLADPDSDTKAPLKVIGLPQTVFVDAQGRMVATERVAFRSYVDLTAAISKHLGVAR